jgi:hypothetical protein
VWYPMYKKRPVVEFVPMDQCHIQEI